MSKESELFFFKVFFVEFLDLLDFGSNNWTAFLIEGILSKIVLVISLCGVIFAEECHLAYNLSLLMWELRLGILCMSLAPRFTWTESASLWALLLFGSRQLSDIETLSRCLGGGKLLGRARAWKCLAVLVSTYNYLWMRWCWNHRKF